MSRPELFVEPDPELPLAILDQKEVLLLNSTHTTVIAEMASRNLLYKDPSIK